MEIKPFRYIEIAAYAAADVAKFGGNTALKGVGLGARLTLLVLGERVPADEIVQEESGPVQPTDHLPTLQDSAVWERIAQHLEKQAAPAEPILN